MGVLIATGLSVTSWACSGHMEWVFQARGNAHIKRQETIAFLQVMPTLLTISIGFQALYACMFWYQQQACQMDLRFRGGQLNGASLNLANSIAVVLAPTMLASLNQTLDWALGGFNHRAKLYFGCFLAACSVGLAAFLEAKRREALLLPYASNCAPEGIRMSAFSCWTMIGPFALVGVAEVYVNPTLYHLTYMQTPPPLRSTAQAFVLLTSGVGSGLFSVI